MMIPLEAIPENECWIDKYANWNTFFGLVVGVVALIITIYSVRHALKKEKQKEEADASVHREVIELQNKALALEEEKMKNEVKPILYIEGVLTNQLERVVKVTFGNSNPKGYLHFVKLVSITDGWQLATRQLPDLQSTSDITLSLTYNAGKNCENFDLEFETEDLYHNKYTLEINCTYKNMLISLR